MTKLDTILAANARFDANMAQTRAQNNRVSTQHQQEIKALNKETEVAKQPPPPKPSHPVPAPQPIGAVGHNINTYA